jgi:hypothetical protein
MHHHNDRNMNATIYVRMVWPFSNDKMWVKPTTGTAAWFAAYWGKVA